MEDKDVLRLLKDFYDQEVENYLQNIRLIGNEDIALKAVGQTLFWGFSLFEFYKKREKFSEWCQKDEAINVVNGMRYARNRVVHQFLQLLYITPGAYFPAKFPVTFFEIVWLPFDKLPKPDKRFEDKEGAEAYKEHLQERPVRFTFEMLNEFFSRAENA